MNYKRIETEVGYREEYENGEIRYYPDYTFNGYCYKDREAMKKGEGVAYIRESSFVYDAKNDGYLTAAEIAEMDDIMTLPDMISWIIGGHYEKGKRKAKKLAWNVWENLSWEGFDMLLNEMDEMAWFFATA